MVCLTDVEGTPMRQFVAVIEKCPDTGLYVGYVPGMPGAHSQGATIEELNANMQEVFALNSILSAKEKHLLKPARISRKQLNFSWMPPQKQKSPKDFTHCF